MAVKSPELFSSVELAQGLFLFVDHAAQPQYDGPFYAGYINGEGFVERHGPVFIFIRGRYGAGLAREDGLLGPFDVGAAAGGYNLEDGDGLLARIGEGESAAEGTVRHGNVTEIVYGLVPGYDGGRLLYGLCVHGGGQFLDRSYIFQRWPVIC